MQRGTSASAARLTFGLRRETRLNRASLLRAIRHRASSPPWRDRLSSVQTGLSCGPHPDCSATGKDWPNRLPVGDAVLRRISVEFRLDFPIRRVAWYRRPPRRICPSPARARRCVLSGGERMRSGDMDKPACRRIVRYAGQASPELREAFHWSLPWDVKKFAAGCAAPAPRHSGPSTATAVAMASDA
jgi:hypothetical protein